MVIVNYLWFVVWCVHLDTGMVYVMVLINGNVWETSICSLLKSPKHGNERIGEGSVI